jgi:hypothetical protein
MAFAVKLAARLLLSPPEGGLITTRQALLNAAGRLVAPPKGLLTLSFDPARFQTEPPACYRASWQLPGRASHPLATTSLCWITIYTFDLQLWAHSSSPANIGSSFRGRTAAAAPPSRRLCHACSGHDVVVAASRAEQQRRRRSAAQTRLPQVETYSLVEGVVLLRLARMGKKRWRALARAVPLGSCGYESLDGVDGDGSHASYRVGLEGGDRR